MVVPLRVRAVFHTFFEYGVKAHNTFILKPSKSKRTQLSMALFQMSVILDLSLDSSTLSFAQARCSYSQT